MKASLSLYGLCALHIVTSFCPALNQASVESINCIKKVLFYIHKKKFLPLLFIYSRQSFFFILVVAIIIQQTFMHTYVHISQKWEDFRMKKRCSQPARRMMKVRSYRISTRSQPLLYVHTAESFGRFQNVLCCLILFLYKKMAHRVHL